MSLFCVNPIISNICCYVNPFIIWSEKFYFIFYERNLISIEMHYSVRIKIPKMSRIIFLFFQVKYCWPVLNIYQMATKPTEPTKAYCMCEWGRIRSLLSSQVRSPQPHQSPHRIGLIELSGTSQKLPKSPCLPSTQSMLT